MQLKARPITVSVTAVSFIAAASVGYWHYGTYATLKTKTQELREARELPVPKPPATTSEMLAISSGDTLTHVLERAGIDQPLVWEIIEAVSPHFDVREFRAGSELALVRSTSGAVQQLEYRIDPDRKLTVSRAGETFSSSITEIPSTLRVTPVCGSLEGSLFESMEDVGEQPELAVEMANIFRWDIDFYKDPQPGDEFCLVVEKKEYANGQPFRYARVLSARYNNAGQVHEAYLFPGAGGEEAWFSRDGESLEAAFLRSPIPFQVRISSRFSRRRLHPVLGRYRPHYGTDYAVPTGTPVLAVADGRVVYSGRQRGAGNLVRVKHANGYETYYLHLSRRLVRHGERVRQGQRIGLVGSTGLATGPHLDFRIKLGKQFQDYEKLKVPKKTKIRASEMAEFRAMQQQYATLMHGASEQILARAD